MNAVDPMDQQRSTNPTRRAKRQVAMSLFTMVIDLSMHNAYMIYEHLMSTEPQPMKVSYREFKRRIAEALVQSLWESRRSIATMGNDTSQPTRVTRDDAVGSDSGWHVLLSNELNRYGERHQLACVLCS